jgi:hypothetical protein
MNQVFDFKRWLLLVGKHWSENSKKYTLSLAAMLALMVIWYSFVLLLEPRNPYPEEMQVATYYIGMAIAGCLYASLFFADLSSGPRAMHFLSVPASHFEKLLTGLFYAVILFFVCYTLIFYLVDFIMISIANGIESSSEARRQAGLIYEKRMFAVNVFTQPLGYNHGGTPLYLYFLVIYFNVQSAFLLGSVYFPSYSFIKTCIVLLLLFLFGVFLIGTVLNGLLPDGWFHQGLFSYAIYEEGATEVRGVRLPDWVGVVSKYLAMYGFLPIFWTATYFRLKEKEV